MKLGILNEFLDGHSYYVKACEDLGIEYEIIDFISSNWIENIKNSDCDGFLVRPSYKNEVMKRMYDEKLYILDKMMNKPIYPSYDEIFLYENKKNMAYFLETNNLKHPKTWVFYNKEEALQFIDTYDKWPLIFKTNIGSAAVGVKFIKSKSQAKSMTKKMFTKCKFYNQGYTKWVKSKYVLPYPIMDDKQYNLIIFQEAIDVKYEWRIIKIGKSYFGHQKLSDGEFHSGSGLVGWVDPPKALLNMAKDICERYKFDSMDIDVFEDVNGEYYINELQTVFGSYDNSQMYIDGKPGRYVFEDDQWKFEEGYFNQNGSYNLRVEDFIQKLKDKK